MVGCADRRALTRLRVSLRGGFTLLTAGVLLLLLAAGSSVASAHAASSPAPIEVADSMDQPIVPAIRADEQYVFSMGIVDRVGAGSLTINFGDGATETYTLNGATTVQTQNGDALRAADLQIGDMVIVLTVENESLARTIVSGSETGFHDAGPADIRGHDERECADCDAHAP